MQNLRKLRKNPETPLLSCFLTFRMKTWFVFYLVVVASTYAAPVSEVDPELTEGYFEGDIEMENSRNGLISAAKHWPGGIVHYKIDEIFSAAHANHIRRGLAMIEEVSCIRFYPASGSEKDILYFVSQPDGCHTKVGYRGGVHTLNLQLYALDAGCFRLGTIMHETLHALGFYHQQSASERDDFVKIVSENITPGKENNFNKYDEKTVTNFGIDYDYGSVMHYSSFAFSRNGEATIVPLYETDKVMGQRREMSKADINKLNVMYRCPIKN